MKQAPEANLLIEKLEQLIDRYRAGAIECLLEFACGYLLISEFNLNSLTNNLVDVVFADLSEFRGI